ncbi:HAMP domain-containing histidine kinase [Herbidospora galbida]|uniref:histidine kinase n=1 Tax=Herbidospora galbida TaxID=2575442 RepID=A0A4U3MBZ9_9ACTN|nr:HAMP domain-containing sensor histidine kinase [Herbidospora galbida]TKK85237.1 HAMP domain-containing histidine kinase [Herbidospora galbida]
MNALLTRARRRVTLRTAGTISVLLLIMGGLVYGVMAGQQDAAARREARVAVERASITSPPPCLWLTEVEGDILRRSPGAPEALPWRAGIRGVERDGRTRVDRVELGGLEYLVHTERRGAVIRQAALDLRYQISERRRLLDTLIIAGIVSLLAAVLIGHLIARRAIAPLGEALARERRFTEDVSHELRTPLARLHTRAQLVSVRLRRGELPVEDVDRLVTGTRELGEVVDDLLLSDRLRHPVDLALLAQDLAEAESPRAESRGVTIEVHRDDGPAVVSGAAPALRRVLSALVDNALTHTAPGGRITITLASAADRVSLTVADDGAGLAPGDPARLFTRHVTESSGYGLGLALVKEVVDGHDGILTVAGAPGEGAAFTVTLPADDLGRTASVPARVAGG